MTCKIINEEGKRGFREIYKAFGELRTSRF